MLNFRSGSIAPPCLPQPPSGWPDSRRRPRLALFVSCVALLAADACAQQPPIQPPPTPPAAFPPPLVAVPAGSVKITFLPPPLEGTLSLGVFDRSGKLVRTLKAEAVPADFSVGLNGLITFWDGRDDAGRVLPPGRYRVRGFAVADLEITGEEFHCNDWVESEDGPHPSVFERIRMDGDTLELIVRDRANKGWRVLHSLADGESRSEPVEATVSVPPKEPAAKPNAEAAAALADGLGPKSCPGKDGTRWSIEKAAGETVVAQFDPQGEVLRRLSIGAGEPVPIGVAASLERDEVFLLEQDGERYRLRGLRRAGPKEAGAAPGWETFLEKNRWPSSRFSEVAAHLGRSKPFVAEAQVSLKSQPNPLLGGGVSDVQIAAGKDAAGSFLKTSDGILLRRLTDTPLLLWVVLGREARQPGVVLLQSDGAVVEEYRILQPGALMSFDAGEYQLPPK
jgi:hypothetical protein